MTKNQEDKINEEFAEWFQGEYGLHRTRLECFFEDCEVKDEKLRKDLILKWVGDAFRFGYKRANCNDKYWEQFAETFSSTPTEPLEIDV